MIGDPPANLASPLYADVDVIIVIATLDATIYKFQGKINSTDFAYL